MFTKTVFIWGVHMGGGVQVGVFRWGCSDGVFRWVVFRWVVFRWGVQMSGVQMGGSVQTETYFSLGKGETLSLIHI